ncbi:MAG: hypothetical protein HC869_10795, partial [Rhodospirillales bacterium]|nr:hypothetical protein [Rhodospirillales bacterium]
MSSNSFPPHKACARRIQNALIALDAEQSRGAGLYLGREDDEKELRRAVSAPPKDTPLAIHAVGHYGIGRKTFLRKALTSVYPRAFEIFVEVTMGQFDGIEEFFRSIYDLHVATSLSQTIAEFRAFQNKGYDAKLSAIAEMITEMAL